MLSRVVRTVSTPFEPGDLRMINGHMGRVLSVEGFDMIVTFKQLPNLNNNDDVEIDGWNWFVHSITTDKVIFRLRGLRQNQISLVTDANIGL